MKASVGGEVNKSTRKVHVKHSVDVCNDSAGEIFSVIGEE